MLKLRRSRAYAMVLFVMVMVIITSLTAVVVSASNSNVRSSALAADRAEARALSQDVLTRFYARFSADEAFRSCVLGGAYRDAANLGPGARNTTTVWMSKTSDVSSRPVSATDASGGCLDTGSGAAATADCAANGCFSVSLLPQYSTDTALNNALASAASTAGGNRAVLPPAVAVQVDTRTRCEAAAATTCKALDRVVQRLRSSQFYDYLFYTQYSTLDPQLYDYLPLTAGPLRSDAASELCGERYAQRDNVQGATTAREGRFTTSGEQCIDIAYQSDATTSVTNPLNGTDRVFGPTFTNDDYVVVCGNPEFFGPVYANPLPDRWGSALGSGDDESNTFYKPIGSLSSGTSGCDPTVKANPSDPTTLAASGFRGVDPVTGTAPQVNRIPTGEIKLPDLTEDGTPQSYDYLSVVRTLATRNLLPQGAVDLGAGLGVLRAGAPGSVNTPLGVKLTATTKDSKPATLVELDANRDGTYEKSFVVGSNNAAVPPVVYVSDDATIEGTYAGTLSLFVEGQATITGDLTRFGFPTAASTSLARCKTPRELAGLPASGTLNATQRATLATFIANGDDPCTAALGLTARDLIGIEQVERKSGEPNRGTALEPKRTIEAVMVSLTRTVAVVVPDAELTLLRPNLTPTTAGFTPDWTSPRWNSRIDIQPSAESVKYDTVAPELEFYGAIATRYQGVYGGYGRSDGRLISGFRKSFSFDSRLQKGTVEVPYLPSPITSNWDRVDYSEVAADPDGKVFFGN